MAANRKKNITLDRSLAQRQQSHPKASGELTRVLYQVGVVGKIISGYLMYGSSVLFVYTAGDGVHSFVLDEQIGEFVLDH